MAEREGSGSLNRRASGRQDAVGHLLRMADNEGWCRVCEYIWQNLEVQAGCH